MRMSFIRRMWFIRIILNPYDHADCMTGGVMKLAWMRLSGFGFEGYVSPPLSVSLVEKAQRQALQENAL